MKPEEGGFYSAEYYRHRPWLLRLPRQTRVTVLALGIAAFGVRIVLGLVVDPVVASWVAVALSGVALVILAIGLLRARG